MGSLGVRWQDQVVASLEAAQLHGSLSSFDHFELLTLQNNAVVINLVSLNNTHLPHDFVSLQDEYFAKNIQMIHLWEDVWATRKEQVLARLESVVGRNRKIHARKTAVVSISQKEADYFLSENHLQLSVGAKHRYALVLDEQLVAVASFSGLRKMRHRGDGYKSAELIRFANLKGVTVIGGFTKLLKHFIRSHRPDDIMSYADRDWSVGKAYERSGFKLVAITDPLSILVNKISMERTLQHRLSDDDEASDYLRVFNTGNFKYVLDL